MGETYNKRLSDPVTQGNQKSMAMIVGIPDKGHNETRQILKLIEIVEDSNRENTYQKNGIEHLLLCKTIEEQYLTLLNVDCAHNPMLHIRQVDRHYPDCSLPV